MKRFVFIVVAACVLSSLSAVTSGYADDYADLTYTTPAGWFDAIVISHETGNHEETFDYVAGKTAYIDVAWENAGTIASGSFTVKIIVDEGTGSEVTVWSQQYSSLAAGAEDYKNDASHTFSKGWHDITLKITPDDGGLPNEYERTVFFVDYPDLKCCTPSGWPSSIVPSLENVAENPPVGPYLEDGFPTYIS
jgi:hypothetical protein